MNKYKMPKYIGIRPTSCAVSFAVRCGITTIQQVAKVFEKELHCESGVNSVIVELGYWASVNSVTSRNVMTGASALDAAKEFAKSLAWPPGTEVQITVFQEAVDEAGRYIPVKKQSFKFTNGVICPAS